MSVGTRSREGDVGSGSGLYVRQSSGLVRAISLRNAIAFNIIGIGVIWLTYVATTEPPAFPGGSIIWRQVG